jgi:hypothetical protein
LRNPVLITSRRAGDRVAGFAQASAQTSTRFAGIGYRLAADCTRLRPVDIEQAGPPQGDAIALFSHQPRNNTRR